MFTLTPEQILTTLLLVGLGIASWRDLKEREVPDLISLGLLAVGILSALVIAIVERNPFLIVPSVVGALAGWLIGIALYYTRQWGGGDAKLLAGVGAVLGLWTPQYRLIAFLILLAFAGALYGIAWCVWLIVRHRKAFKKSFVEKLRTPAVHRMRLALVGFGIFAVIGIFAAPWPWPLIIAIALGGAYLMIYGRILSKTLEEIALVKELPVTKLEEGDWLAKDVKVKNRTIVAMNKTGLSKEDITKLKRANIKNVVVREGIPFVPPFLLALIALLLLEAHGNVITVLFG